MDKFFILLAAVSAVYAFDYLEFQRKYCYEDTKIRWTTYYFPYDTGLGTIATTGYVCENFVLTKSDLDYMARNSFSFTNMQYVFLRNCVIEYLNEYLVSKFSNIREMDIQNCSVSLKKPEIMADVTVPDTFRYIDFYQCDIFDNLNSIAFNKFKTMVGLTMVNSTLQYSYFDDYLLSKNDKMLYILLDNVNVDKFHKNILLNVKQQMGQLACTSCQLEEIDSLFYGMKYAITKFMRFSNNKLKKLPSSLDIFANYYEIYDIDLSNNQIEEYVLKRIHFKSLKGLKTLDLSRNKNINGISYLTFKDTPIENLNMSNVNLENLNKLGNASLLKVDFSHNKISQIPLETFNDLVNLKFLDISYNNILEFQGSEFKHLISLTELRLNSNQLKDIPSNLFNGLTNLQSLDLSYNYLELIDGFEVLKNLQKLNLQGNILKIIPSDRALPNSLRFLDVSKNPLTFIGQNTFNNLNQLTSLDISSTNNTYINFGKECLRYLNSLKSLKFSSNQLSNLEDIYLPTSLEELSLEFNKILKITRKGLENLVYLEYLNISNNHIYYFEDGVIEQLSRIRKLDISGNDL